MMIFFKRHRETFLIALVGLIIFSALNWMMASVNPERFTNPHFGPHGAFGKLSVSGFDFFTYYVVTIWQPRFELYRHPLLSFMMWPLSKINLWFKDQTGINCAIYVVGVSWTIVSTLCWILLYKIIRRVIGLSVFSSLLYCLFFFSLSHVMLATFIPDHMILTLCMLLATIYLISSQNQLPTWKTMLLFFLGTGITLTNGIKIWLMDIISNYSINNSIKENVTVLLKRCVYFLIPSFILLLCYLWQQDNTQRDFEKGQERMIAIKMKKDSIFAKQRKNREQYMSVHLQERKSKQFIDSKLFSWTDTSVERFPMLYENIFGEGFILHQEYLLQDANRNRPVFVKYKHHWYYLICGSILFLFLCGIYAGRKKRLTWLLLPVFLFDMFIHVGMCFASVDAYIMTAHWAFIIPIGIAMLDIGLLKKSINTTFLRLFIGGITIFMWSHNLSLIIQHLSIF